MESVRNFAQVGDECEGCEEPRDADHFRAVDNSEWDGGAAMSSCAKASDPTACYNSICAGKRAGDPSKQEAHALPHHKHAGAPANANGVRNALARLEGTDGLTNKDAARAHLEAHMKEISPAADEKKSKADGGLNLRSLPVIAGKPRPMFVRMANPSPVLMRNEDAKESDMPTMVGHFCVFNRWTHIDSWIEGEFMERIAPGATIKTVKENRENMKVLFNHGGDPSIGKKVLGTIADVREDEVGTAFEVPLFDVGYVRDLIPGLEAKQYGTSFKFRVMKESVVNSPKRSDYNPLGIPERTVEEMEVMEFGPVTFPQYPEADIGLRSITDDILTVELFDRLSSEPERLVQLLGQEKMRSLIESFGPALAAALHTGQAGAQGETPLDEGSRDEGHEFPPLVVIRNPNKVRSEGDAEVVS